MESSGGLWTSCGRDGLDAADAADDHGETETGGRPCNMGTWGFRGFWRDGVEGEGDDDDSVEDEKSQQWSVWPVLTTTCTYCWYGPF